MPGQKAFGLLPSPLSAKSVAQGIRLGDSAWDSDGQTLVWIEGRGDRNVLVCSRLDNDASRDLNDELSVRANIGYGGGDFCVGGGNVFFASGGRLYRQALGGGKPAPITPQFGALASPVISPGGRWILYVFSYERMDGLALADAEGIRWPRKAAEGHDFFMQPAWSADGAWAAWVAWDNPQMPWDGASLYLARVKDHGADYPHFTDVRQIAGAQNVAALQPEFSPDGKTLAYLCDESGWHNFYLYDLHAGSSRKLTGEDSAQLGAPAWVQGQRTYCWARDSKALYAVRNLGGISSLCKISAATGAAIEVKGLDEYTDILQPAMNPAKGIISFMASAGDVPPRLLVKDLHDTKRSLWIAKRATSESVAREALSAPTLVTWKNPLSLNKSVKGSGDNELIRGLLYLPGNFNAESSGAPGNGSEGAPLPPAIVYVHGGPTGQARAQYMPGIQFFTTRGYVVLDVNYRGSTGFGRQYMEALRGKWGVYDVEDAVSGARYLCDKRLADPKKLVILGGSAGGYTVLRTLATHPGFFKAAVCLYGVSNLFTLAADTHKFEARYLDSLVGPLPEANAIYQERSPIFQADRITDPLAVFQGDTDEVVPRAQSDAIVESLKRRNVSHEYHVYHDEGHGWRKRETIEAYYSAVEAFLKRYVLFA